MTRNPRKRLARLFPLGFLVLLCSAPIIGEAADFKSDREFLTRHTRVIELGDGDARVLICPEHQGRVMTSTCRGPGGSSFGWINRKFITAGKPSPQFNNYGGEDRFWLAPEGGQFSLWFAPGKAQTFGNWATQPGLNDGAFRVVSQSARRCLMATRMKLTNASGTKFDLAVGRSVRMLDSRRFSDLFGASAAAALEQDGVKSVGFETKNTITNLGQPFTQSGGMVSLWILGMFKPGGETVIIAPYHAGEKAKLGPVVKDDYFGTVPPSRLKVTPQAILFYGDGKFRSKIGTSQRRAKPVAGSIDFRAGVLTLVHFSQPPRPSEHRYLNNSWDLPQKNPYVGDVFNSYNDGPTEPGAESLGGFYELETLSPALPLETGQSLTHAHRTFHVQGDLKALARLAKAALGVDLEAVRKTMLGSLQN